MATCSELYSSEIALTSSAGGSLVSPPPSCLGRWRHSTVENQSAGFRRRNTKALKYTSSMSCQRLDDMSIARADLAVEPRIPNVSCTIPALGSPCACATVPPGHRVSLSAARLQYMLMAPINAELRDYSKCLCLRNQPLLLETQRTALEFGPVS